MRVRRRFSGTGVNGGPTWEKSAVNDEHTQYTKRWRSFWGGIIALSVAVSAAVVGPVVLITTAAAGAAGAAIVAMVLDCDQDESLANRLRRLGQATAWGAGTLAALLVLGTVSGSLPLWAVVAAVLSSPPAVQVARFAQARVKGPTRHHGGQVAPEHTTRDVLVQLSSAELCRAWQSTHRQLQLAGSVVEVDGCARLRLLLLEELECRHPQEVAAWLAEGGDAAEALVGFLPSDPGST
jgi:hypothetical protein